MHVTAMQSASDATGASGTTLVAVIPVTAHIDSMTGASVEYTKTECCDVAMLCQQSALTSPIQHWLRPLCCFTQHWSTATSLTICPGPVNNRWPESAGGMAVTPSLLALTPSPITRDEPDAGGDKAVTPSLLALTPSPISRAEPVASSPLATLASWRAAGRSIPGSSHHAQASQATAAGADLTPGQADVAAAQIVSLSALGQVSLGSHGRGAKSDAVQAVGSCSRTLRSPAIIYATPQQTAIDSQGRQPEGFAGSTTRSPAAASFTSPELNSLLNGLSSVLLPLTPLSGSPASDRRPTDAVPNAGKGENAVAQASNISVLERPAFASQSRGPQFSPVLAAGAQSTPETNANSAAAPCFTSPDLNCLVDGLALVLQPLAPATASPAAAQDLPTVVAVDTTTRDQDNTGAMTTSPSIESQATEGLTPAVAGSQTVMQSSADHSQTGDENKSERSTALVLGRKRAAEADPQLQVQAHHCSSHVLKKAHCCMPFLQSDAAVAGNPADDQLIVFTCAALSQAEVYLKDAAYTDSLDP